MREALWLLYDFDWTNRVLFYNFYLKGTSLFQNSPMAHSGLPSERELELLEPWRDQVPPRVFTEEFAHPKSSGYGLRRERIKRALGLFKAAGWEMQEGVMRKRRDRRTVQARLHRRFLLLHPAEPIADGQSRPCRHQGHRSFARGVAVALPQPHRQVRRQLQPLGTRAHARTRVAQLVRQRGGRPGLWPELGANPATRYSMP